MTNLTLAESAFSGLIRSPNRYNPYTSSTLRPRRNQVLDSMVEAGELSDAEAKLPRLRRCKSRPCADESTFPMRLTCRLRSEPTRRHDRRIRRRRTFAHLHDVDMDLQRAAYAALTKQLAALDKIQANVSSRERCRQRSSR